MLKFRTLLLRVLLCDCRRSATMAVRTISKSLRHSVLPTALVHADGNSVVKQQDFLLLLLLLLLFIVEMAIFIPSWLCCVVVVVFCASIHDNSIGSNDNVLHFVREYTARRHGPSGTKPTLRGWCWGVRRANFAPLETRQ